VDAILFGGRRTEHGGVPLVVEYGNTTAGVYGGATLSSEQTAAADGKLGVSRIDPFAMYPFYAYHVGDHCAHWLKVFSQMAHPPRFYSVNWFQKDGAGNFAWPGFVDNDRVLDWIDRRIAGQAKALRTPLGYSPLFDDFDLSGLNIDRATFETLTQPRPQFWLGELDRQAVWFAEVGERLPAVLAERHAELCQLFEEAARAV
jgi:phosphoenolpyruvate carboxykinase (GTP)